MGEINPLLIGMLRNISGSKRDIGPQTQVYHELGIAGDDAFELLTNIRKEFGTSFVELNFERYFPNETEVMWYHLAKLVGYRDRKRKNLSVDQLDDAIRNGFWSDE